MEKNNTKNYLDLGISLLVGFTCILGYLAWGFFGTFKITRSLESAGIFILGFGFLILSSAIFPLYKIKNKEGAWKIAVPLMIGSVAIIVWFLGFMEGYW